MNNIIDSLLEVELKNEDDFLKVKETLTRIGISSKLDKKLFQSCHILHKRGKYYICHFKELFLLDGKKSNISEQDIARRNAIAFALESWGLVKVLNPEKYKDSAMSIRQIKVLSHKEKGDWELITKYNIGQKR
jgi:hypothetical protein